MTNHRTIGLEATGVEKRASASAFTLGYTLKALLLDNKVMVNTFNGGHSAAEINITTKPFKSKSTALFYDNNHSMRKVQT